MHRIVLYYYYFDIWIYLWNITFFVLIGLNLKIIMTYKLMFYWPFFPFFYLAFFISVTTACSKRRLGLQQRGSCLAGLHSTSYRRNMGAASSFDPQPHTHAHAFTYTSTSSGSDGAHAQNSFPEPAIPILILSPHSPKPKARRPKSHWRPHAPSQITITSKV